MSSGIVPDELKIAKVVPIHKAGDTKCITTDLFLSYLFLKKF